MKITRLFYLQLCCKLLWFEIPTLIYEIFFIVCLEEKILYLHLCRADLGMVFMNSPGPGSYLKNSKGTSLFLFQLENKFSKPCKSQ